LSRLTLTILLNIVLACCWSANTVYATPLGDGSVNGPIHIEADRMESDQQKNSVLFGGNVEATQGDLVIQADLMTVFYRKTEQGPGKNIDNLEASGNIRIIKKDWLASGDRVEFETEGRKIILTGNTKVWQNNNMVTGGRVVLYLDEGKSVVEDQNKDSGGRVKAFFYPESDKNKEDE
jgi:lipopolysaccharide export system protein LptA